MRYARSLVVAVGVVACGVLFGATAVSAAPVAVGCKAQSGMQLVVTASYRFRFRVGMSEKMYTPAQVKSMHPKQGEVMLGGSMSMGGMPMGGAVRHLEVQICSKATSAVITNANPTITVTDTSAHGMATKVSVAVMEGIGSGAADVHYGNNVNMPAGHRFTVTVTLKGERAVFKVTSPKGM